MANIEVSIKIDMKPTDAGRSPDKIAEQTERGCFRLVLDEAAELDIDGLEDGLLRTCYPALRDALAQHLEGAIKKALAQQDQRGAGHRLRRHASDYRVDGEVGRFTFALFDVIDADEREVFEGRCLLPSRQGRRWYQTCGFKELALLEGAAQRSYRQTVRGLNRWRRPLAGGTPLNTLRDGAEAEGAAVLSRHHVQGCTYSFLERKGQQVFEQPGFSAAGEPSAGCQAVSQAEAYQPQVQEARTVTSALATVCQDMRQRGLAEMLVVEVEQRGLAAGYESAADTVTIHLDDGGVKEQKAQRSDPVTEPAATLGGPPARTASKRPTVQNTVARIEHAGRGFTFSGSSLHQVLGFVRAFLLSNGLVARGWLFFTDGQRSLQNTIAGFFAWHGAASLLLDWYPGVKKFREELSLACTGRGIRNRYVQALLQLLWLGLLDRAIYYLQAVPASELKDHKPIERLRGYLERNRNAMPCYALRRQLRLPNSSHPVERSNNLVTARRQKHNGMSWSKAGSHALTALNAVVLNGGVQRWVRQREIALEFVPKAA